VRAANATVVGLDFSDQLLFPAMLASVQCSVVFDSATPTSYHVHQLPSAPLKIMVAFAVPASGLVTVDVDQSEYGFQ
jgi:hypothetical protein